MRRQERADAVGHAGSSSNNGVVLGPNFAATRAFNDRIDSDVGYTAQGHLHRRMSPVSIAVEPNPSRPNLISTGSIF